MALGLQGIPTNPFSVTNLDPYTQMKQISNIAKATPKVTPASSSNANVPSNFKQAWDFFTGKGFSSTATASILGNLEQESNIDPSSKQSGGPGLGIAQWTNGDSRWAGVVSYANAHNESPYSMDAQLNTIYNEMESGQFGNYGSAFNSMNISDATTYFEKNYEKAGIPNMSNRLKYANDIYSKLNGTSAYPEADYTKWLVPADSNVNLTNVNKDLLGRVSFLALQYNQKITVVSGYRSSAKQAQLYQEYLDGKGNLAAAPGKSNHERGEALDLSGWPTTLPESEFNKYGLKRPVSGENWHVELLPNSLSNGFYSSVANTLNGQILADFERLGGTTQFVFLEIDKAMKMETGDYSSVTSSLSSVGKNAGAFAIRLGLALFGILLFIFGFLLMK